MNNSKPLPSFGLALAPIAVMFALLAIGYGVLGLRIEVLLLISATFTACIAWKMGYNWDDIINAIVDIGFSGRPYRKLDDQWHHPLHGLLGT